MANLYYDEIDSPIGPLTIISSGEKVIRIDFGSINQIEERVRLWAGRYFEEPAFIKNIDLISDAARELEDYFNSKQRDFTIDMEFFGTEFQRKVWHALIKIPLGETKSYKDIAIDIGNPRAIRAVGGAVNRNPFSIVVPCHRIIGTNGKLVGYNGGLDKKEYLLQHEKRFIETF
ncbi:methylated-DNA--[protein]-cysteine S-methyltransferase [Oceanobacillus halophilus]|uniref:Methylated-DNA--protein-cysteine methyltransferase n=1 Tax=Oceanobacillus halophilus TaxID=930130 RepID=A0A494ZVN6_9BACI|nr:methylated-DNA--[protein]-cysteine S-methyltransferase [Oceanobacillus halophilus]RKQ28656.1 methylated-DNA--[protein]-cysteine S-methyltransferase [Oceanobacillus halophilus]